jgi:hypothetical protein
MEEFTFDTRIAFLSHFLVKAWLSGFLSQTGRSILSQIPSWCFTLQFHQPHHQNTISWPVPFSCKQ